MAYSTTYQLSADPSGSIASRSRSRADVLQAEISDVAVLGTLLRPVAFAAVATVMVSDAGLKVTTEADRSIQAIAYITSAIFSSFHFHMPPEEQPVASHTSSALDVAPPSLEFDVNLHTLLECINIFGGAPTSNAFGNKRDGVTERFGRAGSTGLRADQDERIGTFRGPHPNRDDSRATSMKMAWRGLGHSLVLLLEEQDVTTRCELGTFDSGSYLDLTYSHGDTQAQAILASEYLLDAFQSIDRSSCSKVTLLFSNSYSAKKQRRRSHSRSQSSLGLSSSLESAGVGQPMFKISSDGDFGTAETEFPNDISVLEKFSCAKETVNSYRWSHFSRLLKALHSSIRASIRVNDTGLLCVQLMMPKGTGETSGPVAKGGATGVGAGAGHKGVKDTGLGVQGHGFLEFLIAPLDLDQNASEEPEGEEDSRDEEGAGDEPDETNGDDATRSRESLQHGREHSNGNGGGYHLGKRSRAEAARKTTLDDEDEDDGLSD